MCSTDRMICPCCLSPLKTDVGRLCGGCQTYNSAVKRRRAIPISRRIGLCSICNHTRILLIDHDHKTGKVRELICDICNKGMGFFGDSPDRLQLAVNYLRRYSEAISEAPVSPAKQRRTRKRPDDTTLVYKDMTQREFVRRIRMGKKWCEREGLEYPTSPKLAP